MRRIARGGGILLWIAGALVALALAGTFVPTFFGLESLIVSSGSMGRTMPVGSVVLTREVDARAIGVGDIITFRPPGSGVTTTHRVIAVTHQGSQVLFTTKGDANGSADPDPVVVDARIHRVEYVIPEVGYLVRDARSPIGVLLLIVLPIVALSVDRGRKRRPPRRRMTDDVGWSATTFQLVSDARTTGNPATG
jgi:signal peptidase I